MNSIANALPELPVTAHLGQSDLPFVTFMEGLELQVLHVSIESGLWVVRTRFAPGLTLPRHKHTGEVYAITFSGSWKYLEYPDVNTAGSYLFEPAGSTHTLHAPETNTEVTEVWFAIRGANLNLDDEGEVESVWDAAFILDTYRELCKAEGLDCSNIIIT